MNILQLYNATFMLLRFYCLLSSQPNHTFILLDFLSKTVKEKQQQICLYECLYYYDAAVSLALKSVVLKYFQVALYYIKNREDIYKYAEAHNLSDNRKTHTYKKIKNYYISDEKKKVLNSLRLIKAMDKASAFMPLLRNDKAAELFQKFRAHRFNMVHSHLIRNNE